MTPTPSNDELRALALAATPGPWLAHEPAGKDMRYGVTAGHHYDPTAGASRRIAWCGSPYPNRSAALAEEDYANARLIAANNPQRIIAILDEMAASDKRAATLAADRDAWARAAQTMQRRVDTLTAGKSDGAHDLSGDVIRLVHAAREVAFTDQSDAAIRELDLASEAFADRVPWEDEPEDDEASLARIDALTAGEEHPHDPAR